MAALKTICYDKAVEALKLNGKAERTQEAYARHVRKLIEFYNGKEPDQITEDELKQSVLSCEEVNRILLKYAKVNAIEAGREVRVDCTAVESNIHKPYDSELLWDGVRVLTRLMETARCECNIDFEYMNHSRASKRRSLEITNAKTRKKRNRKYKELLKLSNKTVNYAEGALKALEASYASVEVEFIRTQLSHFIPLVKKVIDQTTRRVVNGESVPASEKIYSIFEDQQT